ncbi:tyrosine-protein phosphatase non-receptor type 4 isoform X2 [Dermacentor silvarum]|uniref:tyrosine-protein phosphatase non-receptor type 4 isoform X1 n=3 Tax=Dermacentor silvarum TaxID=543639 RepID=UPI001899D81C|nr:tyrosine-protein phosphatase non-receptor type 4 isoform X1 [Dermacentor silvarum]XP_049517612.1 tyrosine-protein phosphatase non-receptor type 4 isoform X2 [Dermacentor silvarum]
MISVQTPRKVLAPAKSCGALGVTVKPTWGLLAGSVVKMCLYGGTHEPSPSGACRFCRRYVGWRRTMSRRALGSTSGTYHVQASESARDAKSVKTLRCIVFFLDDSQHTFDVEKRSKGQVLFDLVFRHSELVEKDYFGLQFSEKASAIDGMRWLDPVKSIKKQMKVGPPYLLYFRVKFYVSDPSKLQEEWTRYYFFLQLKKDILEGRLVIPPATAALLASYAVQSELGDYNPDDHKHGYLADMRLVPHQTEELEEKIAELHKLHKGQNSADAEFNFLEHAKRLDMYGVDLHKARVRDSTQAEIQLGVTSYGLVVFQNNIRINTFSWAKIVKISFKRKQFFIQLRREGTESYDNLLGFNMLSYRSCKNLWKSCVEHHTFFRLNLPRPTTKRFLFSLGSKFRYSGRTEYQTLEDMKKRGLDDRPFLRSPSKRCIRQTVPTPTDARDKPSKSLPRMNGTSSAHVRPYDSFSHKVQISGPEYLPRKAWVDGALDAQAFTPAIPPKMIRYADDDSLPELIMANGSAGGADDVGPPPVRVCMRPDAEGRFGFNVKGGADQSLPILVSRVVPHTPADTCSPRLREGDQLLLINGRDVAGLSHDQVVKLIRAPKDNGELVLTVKAQVPAGEQIEEPDFQYIPDSAVAGRGNRTGGGALAESMLLLAEGLESGATIAQFEQLYRKKADYTMKCARLPANLSKNRYRDISPYDVTRVILQEGTSGDYINASYVNMNIPTSGIVNRYIATQGPLPNTTIDFWEMVWEQQCTLVVMLTTLVERGRIKCHKYWPDLYETDTYGHLQVSCVRQKETPSFAFREFTLINTQNREERHITHMQYLAWPDHGVPEEASEFLGFVQRVRRSRDGMVEPTVVHCSAGIGRTGVLILMETAMCLIEANEPVYPLDLTRDMRDQRAMLIQTSSQYKFVCEAILKVYNEGVVKPLPEYQRCLTTTV